MERAAGVPSAARVLLARMAKTSAADVAAEVFAMLSSFSRASAQQKKKR